MLKLSNIDRFLPCVTPNLKDYYLFITSAMYYSFECKCQEMVLFL